MPSKAEKRRRKAVINELSRREREEAEANMPISRARLAQLFEHLDNALFEGCDHSLRFTRAFLQEHELPETDIITWLKSYGGYCDCEVLANVEQEWEQPHGGDA